MCAARAIRSAAPEFTLNIRIYEPRLLTVIHAVLYIVRIGKIESDLLSLIIAQLATSRLSPSESAARFEPGALVRLIRG